MEIPDEDTTGNKDLTDRNVTDNTKSYFKTQILKEGEN